MTQFKFNLNQKSRAKAPSSGGIAVEEWGSCKSREGSSINSGGGCSLAVVRGGLLVEVAAGEGVSQYSSRRESQLGVRCQRLIAFPELIVLPVHLIPGVTQNSDDYLGSDEGYPANHTVCCEASDPTKVLVLFSHVCTLYKLGGRSMTRWHQRDGGVQLAAAGLQKQ